MFVNTSIFTFSVQDPQNPKKREKKKKTYRLRNRFERFTSHWGSGLQLVEQLVQTHY